MTMSLVDVAMLSQATKDAYSYDRYQDWTHCVLALAIEGYTKEQAEWILRSKYMRWAGDHSDKEYGEVTADDMLRYINSPENGRQILLAYMAKHS